MPIQSGFLKFTGYLQAFLVFYLLFTHFFVTFYVAIDAIMAIKVYTIINILQIMYPSLLGYYVICVLQLIYKQPKPFWVSEEIISFTWYNYHQEQSVKRRTAVPPPWHSFSCSYCSTHVTSIRTSPWCRWRIKPMPVPIGATNRDSSSSWWVHSSYRPSCFAST